MSNNALTYSYSRKRFAAAKPQRNSEGAQIREFVRNNDNKSDFSHNAAINRGKFGKEDKIGLLQPTINYYSSIPNFVVGNGTVDSLFGGGSGNLFGNFGIFLQIGGLFPGWSSTFGTTGGNSPPGYSSKPLGFAGSTPMGYIGSKPSGWSLFGVTVSKPGMIISGPNTMTGAKTAGPTGPVIKR